MINKVTIVDKTIGGKSVNSIDVVFDKNNITLKELIEARVHQEVTAYNSKRKQVYNGLITTSKEERQLNESHKLKKRKEMDAEKQTYVALDGFLKNQYFVILNNRQIECLDESISINEIETVNFIKLVKLVGG